MIEKKIKTSNLATTADFPLKETRRLRIIFMGTPEFAVPSLERLLHGGFDIAAVVTSPDKPGGRGMQMQQSAIKQFALKKGLPVLQPEKLKDPGFLDVLKNLDADIQVVVAFRMLPEVVWSMPRMGTINLHGSLLPQYRGAAPINWAIINGEKTTGLTTFKLQHQIDTGNILMSASIEIGEDGNAGELHDRMKVIGADLLLKTVNGLCDGSLVEQPQDTFTQLNPSSDSQTSQEERSPILKHAPKIFTDTCRIVWDRPVKEVYNLVRGLSPYPTAFAFLVEKKLKIYKAEKIEITPVHPAGDFETDKKKYLHFACNDGYLALKELQLEGKKKLLIEDFLRGYRWE